MKYTEEELELETWVVCPGHPSYMVSNLGRVIGKGGWLLRSSTRPYGKYIHVVLDGKTEKVHRLVAHAFCKNDNPEEKRDVHHINHNKEDNRAVNLMWCTRSYNNAHRRPYRKNQ